jgi:hypothetical protein
MSSKWSKLKGRYQDAPASNMGDAVNPAWLEKVNTVKASYVGLPLGDLMKTFNGFDEEKDELNVRWKELNIELEALGQLIKDKFSQMDVNSVKTDFEKTIYLAIEPYVSVKDKLKLHEWVDSQPELAYLWGIHPQSLGSLIKGLLDAGQDEQIPDWLQQDIFLKTSVRIRKSA